MRAGWGRLMKRAHGFSIMETMAGIGIVGINDLGMYTGLQLTTRSIKTNPYPKPRLLKIYCCRC